jgi:nucleoid DNA-binding protein
LKIAILLAQYLYQHYRLDLPGLGSFTLKPSEMPETENSKQGKHSPLQGVSFESNTQLKEVPDLIQFISSQTGKIKALATADLESHLELAQQFLNIGKPFSLEGIGTLEKLSTGEFSFTPGQSLPPTVKETVTKDSTSPVTSEEGMPDYKGVLYLRKTKTKWKKPLALALLLAGLALAIWGGYTVYKRTTATNQQVPEKETSVETVAVPETAEPKKDSLVQPIQSLPAAQPVLTPPGNYKFVIETAARERAMGRFSRLKSFGLDVKMETSDSVRFKIFFLLPAAIADTTRMLDSLRGIYTPAGNRAYVEN